MNNKTNRFSLGDRIASHPELLENANVSELDCQGVDDFMYELGLRAIHEDERTNPTLKKLAFDYSNPN
ncbi:MAG: hypothetical protein PHF67_02680 [Candidatus Nanoarchaeia archaeon]|nr:hypothetical protein [Candidatus Nanoarchaeia archaeon]